jgi:sialate O-acetylesterase
MIPSCLRRVLALTAFAFSAVSARADVKLPGVLGSHMVMQQGVPFTVWGSADAGEKISVQLDDQKAVSTEADAKGKWKVVLEPLRADGKTHTLTVQGRNKVTLEDLLIGEVWLGSGQSNMAMNVGKGAGAEANQPEIRLLSVPVVMSKKPMDDVTVEWKACTPETAPAFSAALYHFGQRLHEELKVPIGLINSSKGSTNIVQFMPPPNAGNLYNGSVVPLQPIAMRGAIWYQGEANVMAGDGLEYGAKFKTLIEGWRNAWGFEFPFYFVQIAPHTNYKPDLMPPLWEAQIATLKLPKTGMTVVSDATNIRNIHGSDKKVTGQRLALWALAKDYGKGVECSGPLYKSMSVEGKTIRLTFSHAVGLKSRDGKPLNEFQIAGADGKFVPAQAIIDTDAVVVQADEVAAPTQVRCGWQNAAQPNLCNGAGLPVSPFHTDNWQGGTAE